MSDWRIRNQYGYGVAGLELAPTPPPLRARRPLTLREALAELRRHGAGGALRAAGEVAPGVAMGAMLVFALLAAWLRPDVDDGRVEMVRLELPLPLPEAIPEPPAEPVPEPLAPPAPEPVAEVAPDPVAAPTVRPRPRVEPVAEAVVAEAAPKPRPRVARPRPEPVAPRARPRPEPLRIAPVAPPAGAAELAEGRPEPQRLARALPAPRPDAPRAPAPRFRMEPLAPAPSARPSPAPRASSPTRSRSAPAPRGATPVAAPRFDLAAPPAAPAPAAPPAGRAAPARRAAPPRPQPTRTASRSGGVRRPTLTAPAAAVTTPAKTASPAPRVARSTPDPSRAARRGPEPERLAAVPLSALAACVSDREEDALKLEVVAAVGGARQCVSEAGRYRFVETKNLNAFLMRIERAPSRRATDRCIELRLALECLRARRSSGSGGSGQG